MKTISLLLLVLTFIASQASAQQDGPPDSAPPVARKIEMLDAPGRTAGMVVWDYYQIEGKQISVLLPKLPVLKLISSPCTQFEERIYQAYAKDAVYDLRYYSRTNEPRPPDCFFKSSFSVEFDQRMTFLRSKSPTSEAKVMVATHPAILFVWTAKNEIAKRWVFDDIADGRWIEISVNHRPDSGAYDDKFLNSLKFNAALGKEIGVGSPVMLGDVVLTKNETGPRAGDNTAEPMLIINRNPAEYPPAARVANTQGTVKMQVEFKANGSIGRIGVISGLPNGLTESAIDAARRLAFLPRRTNGIASDLVREVDYSFTIY